MGKGRRETSALRTLRNQIQQTLEHLEIVDASLLLTRRMAGRAKDENQPLLHAMRVNGRYETLNLPAKQHQQRVNYSRGQNLELAVRVLYDHFLDYVREVLTEAHENQPLELVRDAAVDLEPWEVAQAEDEAGLRRIHLRNALRHLEARGSAELILDRTIDELDLAVKDQVRRNALQYLEMRNLFLYHGGQADSEYAREYGSSMRVQEGHKLPRNAKLGRQAVKAVETLCMQLDKQLLHKRLVKAS